MPRVKCYGTSKRKNTHLKTFWQERRRSAGRNSQQAKLVEVAKVIPDNNTIIPESTSMISVSEVTNHVESSLLSSAADVNHTSEANSSFSIIDDDSSTTLLCEKHVPAKDKSPNYELLGRRLVNIGHFFNSIKTIAVHAPFNCTVADMHPISEVRTGFRSKIKLQCKMCHFITTITTDEYTEDENINAHLVTGMLATGGGYSQLQEICAAIDMPCMENRTWDKYHDIVGDNFHNIAWKLMSEAAKEEAKIARQKGEVDENGFPCITVVADAAWAKRSYKTRFDSLSGVAAIVGYETKKILFIGVRNKYCSFCEKSHREPEFQQTREHRCFKNWSGTSTAMESDAIVEGFCSSVEMHGLKYMKLIGDGDSSVHRKLIDALPYGPSQLVEKIECRNHILRGYGSRLQGVCLNRKVGTIAQRNVLKKSIKRLRCCVISAIKYRKVQLDLSHCQRVEELRQDIINGPYHVFGQHDECKNRGYFCDGTTKPDANNLVPGMIETGFFQEIQTAIHRVAANASSLIWDMDNNLAELYNSHVAKAVGGKRVNFALRGSYEARCKAAVISMNSGTLLSETRNSLGSFTKKFVDRKALKRAANRLRNRSAKVVKSVQFVDDDYGPNAACPEPEEDAELTVVNNAIGQVLYTDDSVKAEHDTCDQSTFVE